MTSVIAQFFRNIFTSWAGMVIAIVIAFFFTPYLVDTLGKEKYGIWSLAFSIMAYMRLADLGVKQSIVRYISKYYAVKNWRELNQVFSSSIRLYFFVALAILIATVVIVLYFAGYLKIPADLFRTAQTTILILGINEAVMYFCLPLISLGAFHRYDITSYFRIGRNIVQTAIIIVLLEMGYGLVPMALAVITLTIISNIWIHGIRRSLYPEVRFAFADIDSEKTRMLINYGVYSFLIVGAIILIYQIDYILIGAMLSMEAVAIYSVAAMFVAQIRGAIQMVSVTLVPAISHFDAEHDNDRILRVYQRSTRYLYYISGFIAIGMVLFSEPFMLLWMGPDFLISSQILNLLMISMAVYLPQTIANSVLYGISKHKVTFYVMLIEMILKVVLSYVFIRTMGIIGVAYGTLISQLVVYGVVYPPAFYRALKAPVGPFYVAAFKSLLWSAVLILPPAYLLTILKSPDTWPVFFIEVSVVSMVMLAGLLRIILEKDDRDRLVSEIVKRLWPNRTK